MLELVTLFGISIIGTVFWVINAELSAAVYASQLNYNVITIGIVCALGQGVTFSLVYLFGEKLAARWERLQNQLDKIQERFGDHLLKAFTVLSFIGGVLGFPPAIGMAALAAGLGVSYRACIPFIIAGRFIRFTVIALAAETLLPYLT